MKALPVATEKQVQHAIKKFLDQIGCAVYDTSQPFRAAITPGVADLVVFHPTRGMFFVECKKPGGRQSPPQRVFERQCFGAKVPYVLATSVLDVARFLGATT